MSAKLSFKRPPIKEVPRAQSSTYHESFFTETYAAALSAAETFIRKERPQTSDQEWLHFRTLLVHECEMAKSWQPLWETKEDPQRATFEWRSSSKQSLGSVSRFIDHLRTMDKRQGYDLRDIFFNSAQIAMSPSEETSAVMRDSDGEFDVPTGGRVAQAVELQFLSRLFSGQFDQWLDELKREIETRNAGFQLGKRIGPMFLDPPIPNASIVKLDSTQLAILALTGRLRKALTLAVSQDRSSLPNSDSLGGDMPTTPIACWRVIMDFIQIAFRNGTVDLTEAALKQRWSNATKGRKISFSGWPEAVERQVTE